MDSVDSNSLVFHTGEHSQYLVVFGGFIENHHPSAEELCRQLATCLSNCTTRLGNEAYLLLKVSKESEKDSSFEALIRMSNTIRFTERTFLDKENLVRSFGVLPSEFAEQCYASKLLYYVSVSGVSVETGGERLVDVYHYSSWSWTLDDEGSDKLEKGSPYTKSFPECQWPSKRRWETSDW